MYSRSLTFLFTPRQFPKSRGFFSFLKIAFHFEKRKQPFYKKEKLGLHFPIRRVKFVRQKCASLEPQASTLIQLNK
jgi:hypothetical protein